MSRTVRVHISKRDMQGNTWGSNADCRTVSLKQAPSAKGSTTTPGLLDWSVVGRVGGHRTALVLL